MKFSVIDEQKRVKITLDNECGLKVILNNVGAGIYAIYFNDELMTLTPESILTFTKPNCYYGKTIGPIPNRVENAIVDINGVSYPMEKNEGENCLHSGKFSICNQPFKYKIIDTKEVVGVNFTLVKKKNSDALPGTITYNIAYALVAGDNTLYLKMSAHTDADTPMSLTNHAYFTMGEKKIDALKLTIPAHKFVETRKEDLIPVRVRDILPCLDFQKAKRIDKDINDPYLQDHRSLGYDHCFILDKGEVRLESAKYAMDILTDFEALQIYSDNYNDGVVMLGTEELTHRGLAMEPQDSLLNHQILGKQKFYNREIKYHFTKK